jgi:hypothetical protein
VGYVAAGSGQQSAKVMDINASGQVAGTASVYSGATQLGHTAWILSGGNTLDIGLSGYGFAQAGTGQRSSWVGAQNSAGHVAGVADTYSGSTYTGQTAWLYKNGTTQTMGLSGAAFTTADGVRYASISALNNTGQVLGYTLRQDVPGVPGSTAWLFDGASTQAIGLSGAAYIRGGTGEQRGLGVALNDAGQAVGTSARFNGVADAGTDAWIYSGGMAKQIGLTGAAYTDLATGYRSSNVLSMNQAGQATGFSMRMNLGPLVTSQVAWVYDDDLDVTYELMFSAGHDGSSFSQVEFLDDDGTAFGTYDEFSGNTKVGSHAFAWTAQGGMTDLAGC